MKPRNLLLTFLLVLTTLCCVSAPNPTINEILTVKDKTQRLAGLLQVNTNFKTDTSALLRSLEPLNAFASKKKSTSAQWAYYMLLADGFSIAFDHSNPRSDFFFKKARELVKGLDDPELNFTGLIREGNYHFVYRELKEAFPFFLQANEIRGGVNARKLPLAAVHYSYIANFYSYIGEQQKATEFLHKALPEVPPLSRQKIDIINAIGVYYEKDALPEQAYTYYRQALEIAKQAKDSVWIGIISGNLSTREWAKGNQEAAIALVKKNITLSMKYDEKNDAMRAGLNLTKMHIERKEWQQAAHILTRSIALMEDKPYFLQYKTDAFKSRSAIARGVGDKDAELYNLHQYNLYKDSLDDRSNYDRLQKIYWQWETEKYQKVVEAELLQNEQASQRNRYISIFVVLIVLIIILLINRDRNNMLIRTANLEKERLRVVYEKQTLDQEVLVLKSSLQEFTDTIKENNSTILDLRKEIENTIPHDLQQKEHIDQVLNGMLESHIMTDERWIKFKHIFDRVYPGYLKEQKESYPRFSENDLRIVALTKLDLSNRTMSDMLGVSIDGIKKAKQRMKKKIESTESE